MTELENLQAQCDILSEENSVLFDIIDRLEHGQPADDFWKEFDLLDAELKKLQEEVQ